MYVVHMYHGKYIHKKMQNISILKILTQVLLASFEFLQQHIMPQYLKGHNPKIMIKLLQN